MALPRDRVTVEEFERILTQPENRDRLLELIDGEIIEKMPTEKHGELAAWIASLLIAHVRPRRLGRVAVEARHQVPTDKLNSRLPDVSFTTSERPSVEEGAVPEMPDLAVEIKSPRDTEPQMRSKAHYYLLHGSRMVWSVDYRRKRITVITSNEEYTLEEGDTLTGGDVLPEFAVSVAEVFDA